MAAARDSGQCDRASANGTIAGDDAGIVPPTPVLLRMRTRACRAGGPEKVLAASIGPWSCVEARRLRRLPPLPVSAMVLSTSLMGDAVLARAGSGARPACGEGRGAQSTSARAIMRARPAASRCSARSIGPTGSPRRREPALPLAALSARDPQDGRADPADPRYNAAVTLPYPASHEELWRADGLYDVIVVIGYNTGPPVPGRARAIFLHCAAPDFAGTEGCIAIAREALAAAAGLACAAAARSRSVNDLLTSAGGDVGARRDGEWVWRWRSRWIRSTLHQPRRRFDLCAGAGGAGARAYAVPLSGDGADPARRAALYGQGRRPRSVPAIRRAPQIRCPTRRLDLEGPTWS